jgi:hypothetical protein
MKPARTKEQMIKRGLDAEALLKNTLFNEVYTELRERTITVWQESKPEQTQLRELLYAEITSIALFHKELIRIKGEGDRSHERVKRALANKENEEPE